MTLVCQTDLRNWIPKFLANMKIGQVLSEYVRTVERTAQELTKAGKITALLLQAGFAAGDLLEGAKEAHEGEERVEFAAGKEEL